MAAVRVVLGVLWLGTFFVPMASVLAVLLPFRTTRIQVSGVMGRFLAAGFFRVTGLRVSFADRDRAVRPAVYVCNHTSLLDGFFLAFVAPPGTCYVARRGILMFPFIGQLYFLAGHLLIDRSRPDRAITSLNKAAAYVRGNALGLWIWPEGTRSRDGRLAARFKKGFAHMAIQTGLPVQPVVAIDAHKAWETGTLNLRPVEVTIRYLDPIATDDWRIETLEDHIQEVHEAMAAALPPHQRPT